MKKLLLSLLLLIPGVSYADTVSTGSLSLILITTGSIDRTRHPGDKLNENFQKIDSGITAALAGGGGGAQSSLAGSIATGTLNMNNNWIINVGSMNVFGTVTSTSGFVGDGSKLTGITAVTVQSLPLIEGATNYSGFMSTFTYRQPQTFSGSSNTFTGELWLIETSSTGFVYSTGTDSGSRMLAIGQSSSTFIGLVSMKNGGLYIDKNNTAQTSLTHSGGAEIASFVDNAAGANRHLVIRNISVTGGACIDFGNDSADSVNTELCSRGQTAATNPGELLIDFQGHANQKFQIFRNLTNTNPAFTVFPNFQSVSIGTSNVASNGALLLIASTSPLSNTRTYISMQNSNGTEMVGFTPQISTITSSIFIGSTTVYGTITSTSDLVVKTASAAYFFGNGAGITGITATTVQSLPLIEGATNYSGFRSTFTYQQPQTWGASSNTITNAVTIGSANITNTLTVSSSIVGDVAIATLVIDTPVISVGIAGDLFVPYDVTITSWVILAGQSGSITFDVWSTNIGSYPPTVANTITAAAKPAITTAQYANSATLTGWTVNLNANDTLRFNVDSVTTINRATLALMMRRR
jgi:hypothetical protein